VVEDRPILSAEYRLPFLAKTDPPCSVVSVIAELLATIRVLHDDDDASTSKLAQIVKI